MTSPATLTLRAVYFRHLKPGLEATTAVDYEVQLRHFDNYFSQTQLEETGQLGQLPLLSDVSLPHVDGAMAWQIGRGRSKDTADKLRRCVMAIWNRAAEMGYCDPPGKAKRRHRPTLRVPTAWTIEQFGRILWGAEQLPGRVGPFAAGQWMSALLWNVYNTGWRINGTMQVQPAWVDLDARSIRIEPDVQKDDEGQQASLMPETVAALAPLVAHARTQRYAGIFDDWTYDRSATRPWEWRTLTDRLKRCIVTAGLAEEIADVSRRDLWHKIRRTFATQIYIATGSIEEVRRMLGHSSINVSYRYIDFSQVERTSQADLLPSPKATRLRIVAE